MVLQRLPDEPLLPEILSSIPAKSRRKFRNPNPEIELKHEEHRMGRQKSKCRRQKSKWNSALCILPFAF
jgi:hypothetical protein